MEEVSQNINESDFIIIPNPIYDVVFRYLMEDPDSALIVVSTLINENIKKFALLKLFDQKSQVKDNEHRLRLIRKFFPGFLERVIRRLQSADNDNPYLEEKMFAEDEYLQALINRDNKISFFQEKLEKTTEQLENEKNKSRQLQLALAKALKENGISVDVINKETGLTIEEINKL